MSSGHQICVRLGKCRGLSIPAVSVTTKAAVETALIYQIESLNNADFVATLLGMSSLSLQKSDFSKHFADILTVQLESRLMSTPVDQEIFVGFVHM